METNLKIIKKLEQIFLNDNLTELDKELAKKLILELYENITFEQQEESVEESVPETNPLEEKIKELEKETGKIIELINTISAQTHSKENNIVTPEVEVHSSAKEIIANEQEAKPDESTIPQFDEPQPETSITVKEEIKSEQESKQKEEVIIHETQQNNEHTDNHQTISEVLAESAKTTLYDMIKEIKNDTDLSTKLANMPVTNISKAITLNEKLMFIRELFGGNKEKYDEAVSKLNAAGSLEEALDLLATYNIDTTKESAGVFIKILYRRFL